LVKQSVLRVQAALAALGLDVPVTVFPTSTRTVAEAAATVGALEAQIVKSLVLVSGEGPVLVLASGTNRLDLGLLGAGLGRTLRMATADEVRAITGYAVGGVPPVGHATALPIYIDRDLLRYEVVYAAAGTPNAAFPIAPARLVEITAGECVAVCRGVS
jgi:prolyl-tRNA editing enzyme YbaK/EbsC (Cys-tRNA(Pro) deacylase)